MAESSNLTSCDIYLEGLFALARESRAASDAGDAWEPGWSQTYANAMVAREQFLDAVDRLTTAPGVTVDEARQAAAGILALASEWMADGD